MVDPECPEVSIQLDRILPDIHAMELSFGIAGRETLMAYGLKQSVS